MASIKQKTADSGHTVGTENIPWAEFHSKQLKVQGDATITGDLTVIGNNTTVDVQNLVVEDNLIKIAKINEGSGTDVGIFAAVDTTSTGAFDSGNTMFTGLVKDQSHTDKAWRLFKTKAEADNLDLSSITTTVNFDHASVEHDVLEANLQVPESGYLKVPVASGTLTDYITAVTLGTAKANKVLTVDASKNISGIATLTAQTLSAGNISINGSAISSSSGAPSFAEVAITGGSVNGTSVGGTTPSTGAFTNLTASGNVDLGDASTDTLSINAVVDTHIIPASASKNLGSTAAPWNIAHVGTANLSSLNVSGNTALGDSVNDTLTVTASVNSDILPEANGTRSLGSSTFSWGHVHSANVTATSFSSGNVTVTGGSIGGVDIATSDIVVGSGKALNVTDGTLTTSAAQKLAILEGLTTNADPDLGDNTLTAKRFISDVADGTAPLTVTSTTKVTNLNVDKLDGNDWATPAALGSSAPAAVTATTLSVNNTATITGDLTLSGTDGALTFDAASSIKIADNSNASLVIEEANNAYLTFDTTNSAEKVVLHKNLDATSMVITAATFTGQISSLSAHTTANLTENTNLYFTNERVDDRVDALLSEGQAIGLTYVDNDGENDPAPSLTIAVDTATASTLGVASFASADFDVTSGAVTIKAAGILDSQLAGSISNAKLSNSSTTIAGQPVALGGAITAASIASAIDGQPMAITALTDLDATAAADKTIFQTLNDAKTLTLGKNTGIIAIPGKLALTGDMTDNLHLASGKKYQINSTDVLSATTLGSGVVKSSLTSVGDLADGSIANGFGTISTASNILTTKVIDLASDADVADFSADSTTGRLTLGASDDLNLYHHTDSYIVNKTGSLKVDVPASTDIQFSVAGAKEAHIDADGIDLATGNSYLINNVSVLSNNTLGSAVANSSLTSVGALDSGSITSGFTSIDVGSGAISTSGTLTGGITSVEKLTVNSLVLDNATIGHTNDLNLLTLADGLLTVDGEVSLTTLDIGGTDVTATAGELNLLDGATAATACTLVNADRLIVNDNGVMKQVDLDDFETYFESAIDTLSNLTTAVSLSSVGTITSGTWTADTIGVTKGGTGLATITSGNVLYASGDDTIAAAAPGSTSGVQAHSAILDTFATTASTIAGEIAALLQGEIEVLDGAVKGTAGGDKALVLDSSLDIAGINSLSSATLIGTTVVKVNEANKLETTGLTANKATIDNLTLNAGQVTTSTGDLTLTSALASEVIIGRNTTVNGSLTVTESLTGGENGSITFKGGLVYETDSSITTQTELDNTRHIVQAKASIVLPDPSATNEGREYIIIPETASNQLWPDAGNLYSKDGQTAYTSSSKLTMTQHASIRVISSGDAWYII